MKHSIQNADTGSTIYRRFLTQLEKHATKIALIDDSTSLSYGQLNHCASILAEKLQSQGLCAGSLVVIPGKRSSETIVAMLGVIKAGGAFLPLDTTLPSLRKKNIIADSQAQYLLSEEDIELSLNIALSSQENIGNIDCPRTKPDTLAYTIYTSGTTGQPKGVMIEHRHLLSYIDSVYTDLDLNRCDSFAVISTLAADLSYTLLWSSLLNGATLHVLSEQVAMNAHHFRQYFSDHVIDCLKIVPSHFFSLQSIDSGAVSLPEKCLIFGGEPCQPKALYDIKVFLNDCQLYNHYGPTEATIGATFFRIMDSIIDGKTPIPIGKPLSHAKVCVLNPKGQAVPVGTPGELYLGGSSLARGYLHQEALSKSCFIDSIDQETGRFYKTGDQVMWLPNGNLSFLGRIDKQINLHGHRIELADIESIISQHERVNVSVVVPVVSKDTQSISRLVAFVVSKPDPTIKASTALFSFDGEALKTVIPLEQCLSNYLLESLPSYMIPGRLVVLDQLPLTTNGKVDHKILTQMASNPLHRQNKQEIIKPRNDMENSMQVLWQECLQIPEDQWSIDTSFFEFGGTSLLAIQLVEKINHQWACRLSVSDLYEHNTIELLSSLVCSPAFSSTSRQYLVNFHRAKNAGASIDTDYLVLPHGLAGDLLALYPLANALQDRVSDSMSAIHCVGLQALGHYVDEQHFYSGQEMLLAYEKALDDWLEKIPVNVKRTDKSISLCGWSYGAGLAVVLADMLIKKGYVIDKLIIIDGDPPKNTERKKTSAIPLNDQRYCIERDQLIEHYRLKYEHSEITADHSDSRDRQLFDLIRFLEGPDTCHDHIKRCNQVAISNRQNFNAIEFPTLLAVNEVLLCQSSQSNINNYEQQWREYFTKNQLTSVDYQKVEGDHWSILNSQTLHTLIRRFLQPSS